MDGATRPKTYTIINIVCAAIHTSRLICTASTHNTCLHDS